jgi:hypothetical protein
MFIVGATLGEACIPVLIGESMKATNNPELLNYLSFTIIILMIVIYVYNHYAMMDIIRLHKYDNIISINKNIDNHNIVNISNNLVPVDMSFDIDDEIDECSNRSSNIDGEKDRSISIIGSSSSNHTQSTSNDNNDNTWNPLHSNS